MKKQLFQLLFFSLFALNIQAQCGFSITFDTQAEVDAFPSLYPNCVDLDAYFNIHNGTNITNLDSLQQLRSASSQFWIENCPNLTDISGLSNMKSFSQLRIVSCNSLTSLHGLEQVKRIGSLEIVNNTALTQMISFDSLEIVNGIAITGNPALVNIGQFPRLKTVNSYFLFKQNASLPNFAGAFPMVENLPDLTVDSCASFVSFSGLNHLRTVGNFFLYRNHSLLNFNGLDSLRRVSVSLFIQDMRNFRSLEGMPRLDTIRKLTIRRNANIEALPGLPKNGCVSAQLTVQDCPRLKSFEGMEGCVRALNDLRISGNDSLQNLRGLDSLRIMVDPPTNSLGGAFSIYENALLVNLEGLGNLDSSALGLSLWDNANLISLQGLERLHYLAALNIKNCPRVKNLHGLEALRVLDGSFSMVENDSLETLDGIGPVVGNSGYVTVRDNPRLSECAVLGVCNLTRRQLEYYLTTPFTSPPNYEGNLPGCNSYAEVLDSCTGNYSNFSGRVFSDAECDTLPGGTIANLKHHIIRRTSDRMPLSATNEAGVFFGYELPNTAFSFVSDPILGFSMYPDSHNIATTALPSEYLDHDFRYCPDSLFQNLRVTVAPKRQPNPGFKNRYVACIENRGATIQDAILTLSFQGNIADNYLSLTDLSGGTQIQPNVVSWQMNDLYQFSPRCREVVVLLNAAAPVGEVISTELRAFPNPTLPADIDLSDNLATLQQTIVASLDPNDKTVDKPEINLASNPGDEHQLTYLVRFQNTATAKAETVEIVDTLPENLDIRTIEMLTVSHRFCRMIFLGGYIVKWRFDDINLPDSASNEAQSHGFLQFRIQTKSPIAVGDSIRNRVGIYFDFNPVVLTNFAKTVFYLPVSTSDAMSTEGLSVFPNPIYEDKKLNIVLENNFLGTVKFEILSLDGRILQTFFEEKMTTKQVFEAKNLPYQQSFFVRVSDRKRALVRFVLKF
jgi:uncharacterized repeat protein (TIGR01451 family)